MIIKNNQTTDKIYKGTTEIEKIYKGTVLVYEAWKKLVSQGIPPLTLTKCKENKLLNYQIYGNSKQDGTPTPSTPVEIQSVGDKTKNKFNYKDYNYLAGYISTSGTTILNSTTTDTFYIECKPNTTYTLQRDKVKVENSVFRMASFKTIPAQGTKYTNVAGGLINDLVLTLTTGANDKYLAFSLGGVLHTDVEYFNKVQIEENSTPTDFEPYGYKIPVNISSINKLSNNIFTSLPRTSFEQTANRTLYAEYHLSNAKLKENTTYTIIAKYTNLNGGGAGFTLLLGGSAYPSTSTFTKQGYVCLKFNTLNNLDTLVQLGTRNFGGTGSSVKYENFMILEGDYTNKDIPEYEPYIQPTTTSIYLDEPLRKVGNADAIKLPSGYTQLEYIQSTGTQYIDTGVVPNQDTKVDTIFTMNDYSGKAIYGSRIAYNNRTFSAMLSGADNNSSFQYNNEAKANDIAYQNGTRYHIIQDKNNLYINDVLKQTFTYSNYTCPGNLYLFAVNQNGSIPFYGKISVSFFKIYDNGTLVRDFIPCKNNSNVVGMYDLVNDMFYANQGTGTFTAGPQIYADYIDYEVQKVFRNVVVDDDTGTLPIEESYHGVIDATGTTIELPDILLNKGTNIVDVETSLTPSNLWLKYKGKE